MKALVPWLCIFAFGLALGCKSEKVPSCNTLFGTPSEQTGLSDSQCVPACRCGGETWMPPVYTEAEITAFTSLTLLDGPEALGADPYAADPAPVQDTSKFCAVQFEGTDSYRLVNFDSEAEAIAAGARITHRGACGQCSGLANLAVYMRETNLTGPVRDCGIRGISEGEAANIQCLMDIGFDYPCAEIWYYNTNNTRSICAGQCFALLSAPNHNEDGSLNACIECDEINSGPIFKAVAGRTRRGSGLPSALCRPCDTVYQLDHDYSRP